MLCSAKTVLAATISLSRVTARRALTRGSEGSTSVIPTSLESRYRPVSNTVLNSNGSAYEFAEPGRRKSSRVLILVRAGPHGIPPPPGGVGGLAERARGARRAGQRRSRRIRRKILSTRHRVPSGTGFSRPDLSASGGSDRSARRRRSGQWQCAGQRGTQGHRGRREPAERN